jgi:hypothetical protein
MTIDARTDPGTFIARALGEVCFGDEGRYPLEATIDRYFAPDYEQRTDGEIADRNDFIEHIRALRAVVASGEIEVIEVVRQGDRIADRHRVTVTKRDGARSQLEVYLFGQFAEDGRLQRVDEVSRLITGNDEDANLARTR